ncbi:MAG: MurT ligase domain-containing protein [Propionibacteriaceae bacterium]|nr:MurT ligase domain-containing protein [Propionibacteriaceae bacterium]
MGQLRFRAALGAGKMAALGARFIDPSRGTNISGRIALAIDPDFLDDVANIDPQHTILITGTNGKSTSNNLIVHVLRTAGHSVASNLEGANMKPGAATTLIKNTGVTGKLKSRYLVLEADERSLPAIREAIPAAYLCVTNIQEDQVQRNGDPEYIQRKIASVIDDSLTVIVNNEEPRALALGDLAGRAITYSVAPYAPLAPSPEPGSAIEDSFWHVTNPCPRCHDALVFSAETMPSVGVFHCQRCGFASQEKPDHQVTAVDFDKGEFTVGDRTFTLAYKTPYFLYNHILAYALAKELGISDDDIAEAFATFTNVGGRFEAVEVDGTPLHYIRMKQENPETLQSAFDVIAADPRRKAVLIGLDTVHDFVPHYTNSFYAFDCDLGSLLASGVDHAVCFTETVCYDVANRLRYAGMPEENISIVPSNDPVEILAAISDVDVEAVYLITWLSFFDALKAHLARTGGASGDSGTNAEGDPPGGKRDEKKRASAAAKKGRDAAARRLSAGKATLTEKKATLTQKAADRKRKNAPVSVDETIDEMSDETKEEQR